MAADLYEIVVDDPAGSTSWLRSAWVALVARFAQDRTSTGGVILTVVCVSDGREVFRHIDDFGDDDHLLVDIENDLATMTASEFESTWAS